MAVLAIDITWPEATGLRPYPMSRGQWPPAGNRRIVEKVQGFGGVVLQRSPSLLLVGFGHSPDAGAASAAGGARGFGAALLRRGGHAAGQGEPRPVVRLALHWGAVIVDLHSHNPAAQLLAVGETLALPVRLLGHAAAGEILASGEIGRLVEGWCALQAREVSLGPGSSAPIRAHSIVGLAPRPSRLEARGRPLSRFAGRARELATLEELWAHARGGRGQVAGIVGEPGVGKSRLVYEFTRAHRSTTGASWRATRRHTPRRPRTVPPSTS